MPRTNSDLLQIEGMTARKVERYGPKVMMLLKSYWDEVDGLLSVIFEIFIVSGGAALSYLFLGY